MAVFAQRNRVPCRGGGTAYRQPDYDDELTPEMRERRDDFRGLFDAVLERFRGQTRRALVIALVDLLTEATLGAVMPAPKLEIAKLAEENRRALVQSPSCDPPSPSSGRKKPQAYGLGF